ncbi:MAG: endonuclease [Parcubacteria group bacterium]|nr:endonuclease [Parcubacteria group bacterium]
MNKWQVYILECADGTLYTGVTTNLERRVEEHNGSNKGAKYTRVRRPVALRYSEEWATRSQAQKREAEIKNLPREQKLVLLGI